ncbi:hypothetical protein LTR36_004139 [Oleoguttula mirabilis]|uniref:CT20-domain-containing protein n=1 Tax=Oleoguttula mirabilis TaxID=1507867 RepID=A0AAV9JGY7_9PEZI|nr:hypothetical protein LTR36_004139 [Oleoguttula mirabilis]
MPPRKRAKVSQAASPTPTSQPKTPTPAAEAPPSKTDEQVLNDPWTDEEEIGLFKGLMQWKPTGIHKHFRLIALHQFMLSNGYIHPRNEHTRPAGIWRKLHTLYDLDALDERENARQLSDLSNQSSDNDGDGDDDDGSVYSEAANKIHREDFRLPDSEFAELKWVQRFASEAERERDGESPPVLPEVNLADEMPVRFTPSFSVEPTSEVPTPSTARGGRQGQKGGAVARGRASGRGIPAAATNTRRSTRKAESVAGGSEQAEEGGEADTDDREETAEDDDGEEEESERSTPAARSTRTTGRGSGRGRAAPARGKGRGRGRGK